MLDINEVNRLTDEELEEAIQQEKNNALGNKNKLSKLVIQVFKENQAGRELWEIFERQLWEKVEPNNIEMTTGHHNFIRWLHSLMSQYSKEGS